MAARRHRKRKIINGICIFVYLVGALFFIAPDLKSIESRIENKEATEAFQKEKTRTASAESEENTKMDALLQRMQEYNQTIFENGQSELKDPWAYEQPVLDLEAYGVPDNVVGILTIPKMEIQLPIYQGATRENMNNGAVLLGQTSFPIEGNNINSVIAAHRGWRGMNMFREIEKLEPGDTLTIQNYWETLTYKVTDIQIIMPDDIDAVLIQPDKNMVTLITCHPYTKRYRRYAVFCEKVDDGAETQMQENEADQETFENAESAEQVRAQAAAEDALLIRRDRIGRVAGYVVLVALGIFIIWVVRRKE